MAVFEAIDTALKAASVEVPAREKLGGGYITVLKKGRCRGGSSGGRLTSAPRIR
jgi:microcompartment protein CcmL/EutN